MSTPPTPECLVPGTSSTQQDSILTPHPGPLRAARVDSSNCRGLRKVPNFNPMSVPCIFSVANGYSIKESCWIPASALHLEARTPRCSVFFLPSQHPSQSSHTVLSSNSVSTVTFIMIPGTPTRCVSIAESSLHKVSDNVHVGPSKECYENHSSLP